MEVIYTKLEKNSPMHFHWICRVANFESSNKNGLCRRSLPVEKALQPPSQDLVDLMMLDESGIIKMWCEVAGNYPASFITKGLLRWLAQW